jgi:hypothetical protein
MAAEADTAAEAVVLTETVDLVLAVAMEIRTGVALADTLAVAVRPTTHTKVVEAVHTTMEAVNPTLQEKHLITAQFQLQSFRRK